MDHSFRLTKGVQSVSNAIETSMLWTTENFDTDDLHSTSVSTDRVTITTATAGKWLIIGAVHWDGSASGQRIIRILKNGGHPGIASNVSAPPGANFHGVTVETIIDLTAGDFVTVSVYQDSGGTLDTGRSSQGPDHFDGIRIAG